MKRSFIFPFSIAAVVFVTFLPVLHNGFVNWDDADNLLNNTAYRGLSWRRLHWMFTTFHNGLYRPLTWMTLGLDYDMWGMNPSGYHLTSLVFHAATAVLVYFIAGRLFAVVFANLSEKKLRVAAAFAALIFAVHPLRAEPVAWASGRNDLVEGFLIMLTVLCYLRGVGEGGRPWMRAAWMTYALALMAKGAAVTLPFGLLALDYYPLRRFDGRAKDLWIEKVPFFSLAFIAGLLALYAKEQRNLLHSFTRFGFADPLAQSMYGFAFYLWKTIYPLGLSNIYELPPNISLLDPVYVLSGLVLAVVSVGLFIFRRRFPGLLAASMWYVALLAPLAGFVSNGPQFAADRYSYLPTLSIALLAGAALVWLLSAGPTIRRLSAAAAAALVLTIGALSWHQSLVWRDSEALWRHALEVNPRSGFAHFSMSNLAYAKGNTDEAIEHLRESVKYIRVGLSAYIQVRDNLAYLLEARGDADEAAVVYYDLGNFFAETERPLQAIRRYNEALRLRPDFEPARLKLSAVTLRMRQTQELATPSLP